MLLKCAKTGYVITSLAFLASGLCMILFPTFTIYSVSVIIGVILIVCGIVRIAGYFSKDLYSLAFQFDLALGIFALISGIIFIAKPGWLASVIPVILGIIILVNGLFSVQTALDSRQFGMNYWWLMMAFAILLSAFGIVLIVNPFSSARVMTMIVGIAIALTGLSKLFLALYTIVVKKNNNNNEYIETTFTEIND